MKHKVNSMTRTKKIDIVETGWGKPIIGDLGNEVVIILSIMSVFIPIVLSLFLSH